MPPEAAERRSQRVADVTAILEDHASKHVEILLRVSGNANLPAEAQDAVKFGLDIAQGGLVEAKAKGADAKDKAGPPSEIGSQGQGGRGNQR